ncbi:MAG: RNA-binding protein [Gammaproteobacteria bacterium]|nr:RNA-binding protein [Gammaproteobacteria bacterium]
MSMTIYVANLPDSATEQDVQSLFNTFGKIESVKLITDSETGKPSGFGFIEMEEEAANKAIKELDDTEFQGQKLQVNQARGRSTNR